jgi:hypothetical protein
MGSFKSKSLDTKLASSHSRKIVLFAPDNESREKIEYAFTKKKEYRAQTSNPYLLYGHNVPGNILTYHCAKKDIYLYTTTLGCEEMWKINKKNSMIDTPIIAYDLDHILTVDQIQHDLYYIKKYMEIRKYMSIAHFVYIMGFVRGGSIEYSDWEFDKTILCGMMDSYSLFRFFPKEIIYQIMLNVFQKKHYLRERIRKLKIFFEDKRCRFMPVSLQDINGMNWILELAMRSAY